MKKIQRLPSPECFNNQLEKSKKRKIGYYENLRDANGKIYPRWNTTCKAGEKISQIRKQLLEMSDYCCVYCGIKIDNDRLDVDHYLASSQFPYLAYCWDNLLPTCKTCNQTQKIDFTPFSLQNKQIVEEIVADKFEHDLIYDKEQLLHQIAKNDRLIEPTFDDPEIHLAFNPEFYCYEAKTPIGEITINTFFPPNEIKIAENFEKLSNLTKKLILKIDDPQGVFEVIRDMSTTFGYEYVFLKFYEYWLTEKEEGRIHRN